MNPNAVVDVFVERLQASGADLNSIERAPWLDEIESRLGLRFPAFFRALVSRYAFPVLDLGKVELFANLGDGSQYDLTVAPFRDPVMSPWLAEHRLLHIGFPCIGNYDPICFDLTNAGSPEPPIIKLEHEAILLARRTVGRAAIAPNFLALLAEATGV
ncbi:MAG: SMI1/KNR4 family protein [candidate division NC10 bacterium]|nr:SMI1/KNR4 family protein [candidate division NC10 bacterium]